MGGWVMGRRITRASARSRRGRRPRIANVLDPMIEQLESRRLLSTVVWDGGPAGNGTSFLDPTNWAGDVVPGSGDTANIGATGTNPLITLSGTLTGLAAINSSRNILLTAATINGGTVTTTGTAVLSLPSFSG